MLWKGWRRQDDGGQRGEAAHDSDSDHPVWLGPTGVLSLHALAKPLRWVSAQICLGFRMMEHYRQYVSRHLCSLLGFTTDGDPTEHWLLQVFPGHCQDSSAGKDISIQQCLFLSCLMQKSAASMILIFICISHSVMELYSKKVFVSKALFLYRQIVCIFSASSSHYHIQHILSYMPSNKSWT